jgi:hypothetical protein
VTFCAGDCLNHKDFTDADKGIKEKQTVVDEVLFEKVKKELADSANIPISGINKTGAYKRIRNVYRRHEVV